MFRPLCSSVRSHCLFAPVPLHPLVGGSAVVANPLYTRWILTSSTDHLDSAISSKMTSTLNFQSFPLSSYDVRLAAFVIAVDSPCLTNCICLCFESAGRFRFLSTSIHQPTPAGFVMSLPKSELFGILIEYASWSLSFNTVYSCVFTKFPLLQVCRRR